MAPLALLIFVLLGAATFHPSVRSLYARNPAFVGMVLTLCACFLGVYGALEFSRAEERQDRMARAATLMETAKEALAADRLETRDLAGPPPGDTTPSDPSAGKAVAPGSAGLDGLLSNGAVLEQISPQSLKALLACQAGMQRELKGIASTRGRARRHHLNGYLRELAFARGVLAAESEFQRGRIGRGDLDEILRMWTDKKSAPPT